MEIAKKHNVTIHFYQACIIIKNNIFKCKEVLLSKRVQLNYNGIFCHYKNHQNCGSAFYFIIFFFMPIIGFSQANGDFRTRSTGNWNDVSTWQERRSGSWVNLVSGDAIPNSGNSIFVQRGHTLTINIATAACNNLHIETTSGANAAIAIGSNILEVSGFIRAFTQPAATVDATDGNIPGANATTIRSNTLTSSTSGRLKFIGNTRDITTTGTWGNAGIGTGCTFEFALNTGQSGTFNTTFKATDIIFSSGTINLPSSIRVVVGTAVNTGSVTIKNGAVYRTAATGTTQVFAFDATNRCGTVSIETGGELNLTGPNPTIDCNSFINNGLINYARTGGATQTLLERNVSSSVQIDNYFELRISGNVVKTVSIPSGLSNINIRNQLNFTGASAVQTFQIDDLKKVTLISTNTETALVANLGSNIISYVGSGSFVIQRFIAGGAGRRKFRFLSHPFTTAQNINVLGTSISYTGAGGTGSGFSHSTVTNAPSVFSFTTANANGGVPNDAGWTAVTAANAGTPWARGQGIRILVRGAFAEGLDGIGYTPSDATISMTGTVNTGTVNVPIVLGGSGATQDLNLVGNPYPSPVNIGEIVNGSSLVTNKTILVRNPTTGAYLSRDVSNAPYTNNYTLNSLSAFFVRANAAGNLVFNESNKATTESGDVVFSEANGHIIPMLELEAQINGDVYDNYIVKFGKQYSKGFNKDADAVKLQNDFINLYSKVDNNILSVDARSFAEQTEIPLGINISSGKQTITLKNTLNYLTNDMEVVLWDKYTNVKTKLDKDASYTLELDKANAQTIGEDRLVLLLNQKQIATIVGETLPTATVFSAKLIGSNMVNNHYVQVQIQNPAKQMVSAKVINMLGQLVQTVQGSKAEQQNINLQTNSLQAGKYFIEVVCGEEKQMLTIIKN